MGIQLDVTVIDLTKGPSVPAPSAAADFIRGTAGDEVINSGAGNDRVWAGKGDDVVNAGDGDDFVDGGEGSDVINGGNGNDRLYGGSGTDTLHGDSGNDWLSGGSGIDLLFGDDGNDALWGDTGNDYIDGGEGSDMLNGGSGDDRLTGGAGKDRFEYWVDNSRKSLNFGDLFGNDEITDFTQGQDTIDMRSIFARFSDADVAAVLDMVTATMNGTGRSDYSFGKTTKTHISAGDVTVGERSTLHTTSLSGDQVTFDVLATEKTFNGTVQKDFVLTIYSDDPADKGATIKFDDLSKLNASDFLRESQKVWHGTNAADGSDSSRVNLASFSEGKGAIAYGFGGDDVITGTSKNDTIFGGADNDTLYGMDGNDDLRGEAGVDRLWGGNGSDSLNGGAGNDFLDGQVGNDLLYGGSGDDTLTGGSGKDTFIIGGKVNVDWDKAVATFNVDTGNKVITDFFKGEDTIRFADFFPNGNLAGSDLRNQFVANWMDDATSVSGSNLVISGKNTGLNAGNYSITVNGLIDQMKADGADLDNSGSVSNDELHTYLKAVDGNHLNWQEYFTFG